MKEGGSMIVADYERDMILGQKWAIEVHTDSPIESECRVQTFHYNIPWKGKNPYLRCEVDFFRIVHDEIILVVHTQPLPFT